MHDDTANEDADSCDSGRTDRAHGARANYCCSYFVPLLRRTTTTTTTDYYCCIHHRNFMEYERERLAACSSSTKMKRHNYYSFLALQSYNMLFCYLFCVFMYLYLLVVEEL